MEVKERPRLFKSNRTDEIPTKLFGITGNNCVELTSGYLIGEFDPLAEPFMSTKLQLYTPNTNELEFELVLDSNSQFTKERNTITWRKIDENEFKNKFEYTNKMSGVPITLDKIVFTFENLVDCAVFSDFLVHSIFAVPGLCNNIFFQIKLNETATERPDVNANNTVTELGDGNCLQAISRDIELPPLPNVNNLSDVLTQMKAFLQLDFEHELLYAHFKVNDVFNEIVKTSVELTQLGGDHQRNHDLDTCGGLMKLYIDNFVKDSDMYSLLEPTNFSSIITTLKPSRDFTEELGCLAALDVDNDFCRKYRAVMCIELLLKILDPQNDPEYKFENLKIASKVCTIAITKTMGLEPALFNDMISWFFVEPLAIFQARLAMNIIKAAPHCLGLEAASLYDYAMENGLWNVIKYCFEHYADHVDEDDDIRSDAIDTLTLIREIDENVMLNHEPLVINYLLTTLNSSSDECKKNLSGRALQIHALEILKKLMNDSSDSIIVQYFDYLSTEMPKMEHFVEKLPLFIEPACFALYVNRDISLILFKQHDIWTKLNDAILKQSSKEGESVRPHALSQAHTALARSVMVYMVVISELPIADFNTYMSDLLESGLMQTIIKRMHATRSSCVPEEFNLTLIFLNKIVDSEVVDPYDEEPNPAYTILANWMVEHCYKECVDFCEVVEGFDLVILHRDPPKGHKRSRSSQSFETPRKQR